jgi:hypothetical protein
MHGHRLFDAQGPDQTQTHATKLAYRLISAEKLGPDNEYACAPERFALPSDLDLTSKGARKLIRDRAGWTLPSCPTCAQLIVEALSIRAGKLAKGDILAAKP